MTFKMLIVDDEPIITRGLRLTIPWESIKVEVVDTAHDGDDAIQKVKQYGNIDIVITDVRMPKADGLQLASFLYANYPHIRTIILSGFDEFEYAQQAIKLGVENYLLKPVNINELVENVKNITNKIKQEQQQKKDQNETGLRNAIIQQLSNLQTKSDPYNGILIYTFISMHQNYRRKINNLSAAEYEEFLREWEKTIESGLHDCGLASYSFFTEENILVTCVISEDGRKVPPDRLQYLKWNDRFTLHFVWNDEWIPIKKLKTVLTNMVDKGRFLPFTNSSSIVVSNQLSRTTDPSYPTKLEKAFIDTVIQMKDADVYFLITELFEYFLLNEFFLEEVVHTCRVLLNKILNHYEALGGRKVERDFYYNKNVNVHVYNSYELLEDLFYQDLSTIRKEQSQLKNETN